MLYLGFLGGPTPDALVSPERIKQFDERLSTYLALQQKLQPDSTPTLACPARNFWEQRATQVAHALGWTVDIYTRENEFVPKLMYPNQSLFSIPGYKAWEEYFNAECSQLLFWEYRQTFIPAFRRVATYVHLDVNLYGNDR